MKYTLDVASLRLAHGTRVVLDDLTFVARAGTMTAVTGASGSGKSTLLNVVGLLERPTGGTVTFDGTDVTSLRGRAARLFRRSTLGYLFQNYGLIESETIRANLKVVRQPMAARDDRILESALEHVGLSIPLSAPVAELSGGEQQRVALARLVLKKPKLVLADEPTGALDAANADHVVRTLRTMADAGAVVLVATHSENVADACDTHVSLGQLTPTPCLRRLERMETLEVCAGGLEARPHDQHPSAPGT